MARHPHKPNFRLLLRFMSGVAILTGVAVFLSPEFYFEGSLLPSDAEKFWQMGGALLGAGLVVLVASFIVRDRKV